MNNSLGYNHIVLFAPADASKPVYVTDGKWEVAEGILGVNEEKSLVYVSSVVPSMNRSFVLTLFTQLLLGCESNLIST